MSNGCVNKSDNDLLRVKEMLETIKKNNLKIGEINNRRYLGNKYSLREFIKETVDANCKDVNIVIDIFSGTGAVADLFKDKMLITNDLLYSNYISNYAWFSSEEYSQSKIINYIIDFNKIKTSENNYMRMNFADTFFSADDCSKIGFIRELIDKDHKKNKINFKEFSILVTSLLYGIDRIANTVGHYDAYRKNGKFDKDLIIPLILPDNNLNPNNQIFNKDANVLIKDTLSDLLYLDPPYNSRQYSDAYHLLENVAKWNKPKVYGVARKMNRDSIKSEYNKNGAAEAFEDLVNRANTRYILLSYNNMGNKGNNRSNAKISDKDILRILNKKGRVKVFETKHKSFTTGKSNHKNNTERLFLCETYNGITQNVNLACPFNYIGGKHRLLPQIKPLLPQTNCFVDLFAGGCNVSINSNSTKIICNDSNSNLIGLLRHIKSNDTKSFLKRVDIIIEKYKLSNTNMLGYQYYDCNSSNGLAPYNKDKYLKLRNDYNNLISQGHNDWDMLYVLIVYAFNNQIRFNKKGEFNLPVGKRDFNSNMREKFILFSNYLKKIDVSFLNKDFREVDLSSLPEHSLIYCDPPYLITEAPYNESGQWTEQDEIDLLAYLNEATSKGYKFALSNVIFSKGKENTILSSWAKKNKYNVHQLNRSYSNSNYQRKNRLTSSGEVLITNY